MNSKSKSQERWIGLASALAYDNYEKKNPMYSKSSKAVVDFAEIQKGMAVLDLACGTGATTKEILKKVGTSGYVIAVDSSKDMLEIARKNISSKNVEFICSKGESVGDHISGMDRAVCNSALWQMNIPDVVNSVYRVLKSDGKFVFSIPEEFYKEKEDSSRSFNTFMKRLAVEKYGISAVSNKNQEILNRSSLAGKLEKGNLQLDDVQQFSVRRNSHDFYEWLKIPSISKSVIPNLSYEDRMSFIDEVYSRRDEFDIPGKTWYLFSASKKKGLLK